MSSLAHWDEVEPSRRERGHLAGAWYDLGTAAGTVGAGVKRIVVDAGRWSTPAHQEGAEEEIFYVLAGSGLSWQDGAVHEVGAGDCLVHLALAEAHTLRAGDDGLDVLAFGLRVYASGITHLPRAGVAWLGDSWGRAGGDDDHPWTREAAAGEPPVGEPAERPATIVNVADVDEVEREHGRSRFLERDLGRAAGSQRSGISWVQIPPARTGWPPHCHSAEEEIFVVLAGEGTFVLGDGRHPVRAGSVVGRPPGSGIAHSFEAGDEGLTYLAYGTREPNDIAYYPRSNKVAFRGVGLVGRLEPLEYWDGEPRQ